MLYCCLPLAQALIYLKTTKREEQSLKEQSETFNYLDMEKNKIEKLSEKLISSREKVRLKQRTVILCNQEKIQGPKFRKVLSQIYMTGVNIFEKTYQCNPYETYFSLKFH